MKKKKRHEAEAQSIDFSILKPYRVPEIEPFYIGPVRIPNPVVLAPLAGITDIVFRNIIKSFGAGLVYTEMISCHALHYNNKKTWKLAEFTSEEQPVSVQIFGDDPVLMSESARAIEALGVSIIDINLGCSVPKVVKGGGGAGLARVPENCAKVMEAVVNAVSIPVTVKMRIGRNRDEVTAPELCRIARETGIKAVALHGRTSVQKYGGTADWEFIRHIRETAGIPVIGNGDIRTPEDALEKLRYSGCPGIMIGRESYANPWVFCNILLHLQGKPYPPHPSAEEVKSLMIKHLDLSVARYGEESGVDRMRKFVAWYTKGLRNSTRFRELVFKIPDYKTTVELIEEYFHRITPDRSNAVTK